jgi:hypothetical protein
MPEEDELSKPAVASQRLTSAMNGFHPRGSMHAFTAMAEAAL